jgi:hypothetical protein
MKIVDFKGLMEQPIGTIYQDLYQSDTLGYLFAGIKAVYPVITEEAEEGRKYLVWEWQVDRERFAAWLLNLA